MKITPDLGGVPETALWTLYNRASEAKRQAANGNGLIHDPEAIRIYDAIDYPFDRHFGTADGSHAVRANDIDIILRRWLAAHPAGSVVSLGEGLETQFSRVDNGSLTWLTVDLPESIRFRAQFLPSHPRCHTFVGSALDRSWMDLVRPQSDRASSGEQLCIIAQGLFMYLPAAEVQHLLVDLAARFPGCLLVFDTIPHWLARLTQRPGGLKRTKHYTVPVMPWGIDCNEVTPTLLHWGVSTDCETKPYRLPRGLPQLVSFVFSLIPRLRAQVPAITAAILRPNVRT
jgi:O-methyltransferase involved in polyketide biosynthesis